MQGTYPSLHRQPLYSRAMLRTGVRRVAHSLGGVVTVGAVVAVLDASMPGRILPAPPPKKAAVGQDSLVSAFRVGDGRPLRVARFAPDGKRVATATYPGVVRIWDWASGREVQTFPDEGGVASVVFAHDGRALMVGHEDGHVSLWDLDGPVLVRRWAAHTATVYGLAIRRDGTLAATGSDDGLVKLWDVPSGALVATLEGHGSWVGGVAFTPDGRRLLSASADSTVRIWDVATHATLQVLRGHDFWVRSAVFVGDGARALSGGYDGDLRLWDCATGATLRVMHADHGQVYGVAAASDGRWAVAVDSRAALGLWDLTTGREVHLFRTGSEDPMSTVSGDMSADGRWALVGERSGAIYVWDLGPSRGGS